MIDYKEWIEIIYMALDCRLRRTCNSDQKLLVLRSSGQTIAEPRKHMHDVVAIREVCHVLWRLQNK